MNHRFAGEQPGFLHARDNDSARGLEGRTRCVRRVGERGRHPARRGLGCVADGVHGRGRLLAEVEHPLGGDALLLEESIEAIEEALEASADRVGGVELRALDDAGGRGLVEQRLRAGVHLEAEVALQVGELLELRADGGEGLIGAEAASGQLRKAGSQRCPEGVEVILRRQTESAESLHRGAHALDALDHRGDVVPRDFPGKLTDLLEALGRLNSQLGEDVAEVLELRLHIADQFSDRDARGEALAEGDRDRAGGELRLRPDAEDRGLHSRIRDTALHPVTDGRPDSSTAQRPRLRRLLERLLEVQSLG